MSRLRNRCSAASVFGRRTFGLQARRSVLGLVASFSVASIVGAAPFVPGHDDVVLERVPAAAQLRGLQSLRRDLAANPQDEAAALKLSRAYLDLGRSNGDPRFISYAQATLAQFLQHPQPSVEVLTLGATILQSSHRFDEALAQLERALRIDARNPQALLTKATVLQVRGEFGKARQTCRRMIATADPLIALTCIAGVDAMNGRLAESYAMLERALNDRQIASDEMGSWLLGQLGEMSVRLGRDDDAERHFKAALIANPDDLYVKGEYADLLLRQRRTQEVLALLEDHEAQDALLLRLAQVESFFEHSSGRRWRDMYAARYAAARRDRDATHLREQARYELEIRGDASAALRLAQQNWQIQREPADIRILVRAARAAHDPPALERVAAWIRENRYEDRTLASDVPKLARRHE